MYHTYRIYTQTDAGKYMIWVYSDHTAEDYVDRAQAKLDEIAASEDTTLVDIEYEEWWSEDSLKSCRSVERIAS